MISALVFMTILTSLTKVATFLTMADNAKTTLLREHMAVVSQMGIGRDAMMRWSELFDAV
jgi:hypothetical protein